MYFVWKRNDGQVSATAYPPTNFIGSNRKAVNFEQVGRFQNRGEAYDCIDQAGRATLPAAIR